MTRSHGHTRAGAALAALSLLATVWGANVAPPDDAHIDLYMDGLVVTPSGVSTLAPGAAQPYLGGTRVPAPSGTTSPDESEALTDLAAQESSWIASGTVPGAGTRFEPMATSALADLHAMLADDGTMVAALHPRWAYSWPRDNSFAAAAFARTGHPDEAVRVLAYLERVQAPDGSFEARYTLDGAGPPDDRAPQTDGTGWALWSLGQVLDTLDDVAARATAERLRPLLDRSTDRALALLANPSSLPPASPDYWEVDEKKLTLGTAAPLLAGLEAASDVYALLGEPDRATLVDDGAARLRAAIEREFGSRGYPRHVTGGPRDAATAFLLPPFVDEPLAGAVDAWRASVAQMQRPAGGLAPGGSWKKDGISWTPQTSLYALAAAAQGDRTAAEHWLGWIDEHRTASGAIPEKVLADGSPAAVAPLAWSASNVLLALATLED
ncbi:hypothetical protein ATL41_2125 [Flavimobilis soli]|uniref:GH15 family glucan-1,4-alpha-glucosidase n=1 Tax=Flavimobilis soli TaxID=442709 RepID=A0A2A9EFG7_9MICO|nr:glycoside hydrolase family 15 [Flavimobilis soli]PFG37366.1 hypothetical protein ATL41_2125 [Flavimobilis soli]